MFRSGDELWMATLSDGFVCFGDTYSINEKTVQTASIEPDEFRLVHATFRRDKAVDIVYVNSLRLSCDGVPICAGALMSNSQMSDVVQCLVGQALLTLPVSS